LYAKAPYFRNVKTLNSYSQPRPVSPNYLTVSNDLQVMLSEVFANTKSPAAAISSEASQIRTDSSATPSS
jgi:maltose-binding protein MalE